MKILDYGYVDLIEKWGSDERIIEAARMSTKKGFEGWGPKINHASGCDAMNDDWNASYPPTCNCGAQAAPGDEKLLKYLYDHKHMTPFEMGGMIIEVQAPIFVFREWHRHRTQSYNELSARYTVVPEVSYVPSKDRLRIGAQSSTNKQSSSGFTDELSFNALYNGVKASFETNYLDAWTRYQWMLKQGVARELASRVLPTTQYSRMRASANLRNWLSFLTLRMDESAQWEIRQYANAVGELIAEAFPRTWELFKEK